VVVKKSEAKITCLQKIVSNIDGDCEIALRCLIQISRVDPETDGQSGICRTNCSDMMCEYFISFAYGNYCSSPTIFSAVTAGRNK